MAAMAAMTVIAAIAAMTEIAAIAAMAAMKAMATMAAIAAMNQWTELSEIFSKSGCRSWIYSTSKRSELLPELTKRKIQGRKEHKKL